MLSMAATLSRRALAGTCASFVVRHATSLSRGREAAAGSAADVLDLTSPIDDAHYVLTRVYPRPWGAEPAIDLAHILPGRAGALLRPGTRVAVVREPFRDADAAEAPLGAIISKTSQGAVDFSPSYRRGTQLVDVYTCDGRLTDNTSVELAQFVRGIGVQARVGSSTAVEGAPDPRPGASQSTNEVLMVAPTAFRYNEECAEDNHFMVGPDTPVAAGPATDAPPTLRAAVLQEYAGLYDMLANEVGLRIHLFQHATTHDTPDACFPNNW